MAPIIKENEVATARTETALRPTSTATLPGDTANKQQPVALEVPVTVNGARTVEGSDKREPFSESTKTVLIFGNGAVIRLSSSVAPGQLLFLTNEKTKKEVVCQVVKSKNYRNVSGYVELEFTEPVVGFWGMRFPGDRIGLVAQPVAPVATLPRPVAPKIEAPATNVTPSIVAAKTAVPSPAVKNPEPKPSESKFAIPEVPVTKLPPAPKVEEPLVQKPVAPVARLSSTLSTSFDPEAPLSVRATPAPPPIPVVPATPVPAIPELSLNSAPATPVASESLLFDSPRASESQASFLEPAKSLGVSPTTSVPNLLALFEANSPAPAVMPAPLPSAPAFADPEAEALKQHTARLQEQLSGMQFAGETAAPSTVSVQIPYVTPVLIDKELAESARRALEASQMHVPEPEATAPVEPVKTEPLPAKGTLEDEQLEIPAWLEPLARNAAAPVSTQDLIEREKAKRLTEQPKVEEILANTVIAAEETRIPELPLPTFGNTLPLDDVKSTEEIRPGNSKKFIWIAALAAGIVLLAVGGWWYMQQPTGAHAAPVSASNAEASVAAPPLTNSTPQPQGNSVPQNNPPPESNPAPLTNAPAKSISASNKPSVVPASESVAVPRNPQPASKPAKGNAGATPAALAQPAPEQPKKPILGELHLASPKVTPNRRAQNPAEADAGITLTNDELPESGADALNAGLVGGSKQPSAPAAALPIGGDVKQAKLIASTTPAYPSLAKTQHVSGNVLIDALIDANGRVTTMKVVSGPTLLHQAAMDALRQWKYQPATLDGKPVPMHLTVTIQFRLQ